jgi:hypothetical protein
MKQIKRTSGKLFIQKQTICLLTSQKTNYQQAQHANAVNGTGITSTIICTILTAKYN